MIINEAPGILAKGFGGADGHKYVNGVLCCKLAAKLRPTEVEARRPRR